MADVNKCVMRELEDTTAPVIWDSQSMQMELIVLVSLFVYLFDCLINVLSKTMADIKKCAMIELEDATCINTPCSLFVINAIICFHRY